MTHEFAKEAKKRIQRKADRDRLQGGERAMSYPIKRNLDGIYHHVERDGEWFDLCWTDLTDDERERVSEGLPEEWWRDMALYMTRIVREIGDQLGIVRSGE